MLPSVQTGAGWGNSQCSACSRYTRSGDRIVSLHRSIARWTLPLWLYVSVTGVIIYVLLYHIYTPAPAG